MQQVKFEFNYWEALNNYIKETYPTQVVFLYDMELSFFDADEEIPKFPFLYTFDTQEEFITWIKDAKWNIDNLSVLWVNGERDEKIIYKLRG